MRGAGRRPGRRCYTQEEHVKELARMRRAKLRKRAGADDGISSSDLNTPSMNVESSSRSEKNAEKFRTCFPCVDSQGARVYSSNHPIQRSVRQTPQALSTSWERRKLWWRLFSLQLYVAQLLNWCDKSKLNSPLFFFSSVTKLMPLHPNNGFNLEKAIEYARRETDIHMCAYRLALKKYPTDRCPIAPIWAVAKTKFKSRPHLALVMPRFTSDLAEV